MNPKPKPEPKNPSEVTRTIHLEIPAGGARVSMPFNRFSVERFDAGRMVRLGFFHPSGALIGSFQFFISDQDLLQNKKRCVAYAEKLPRSALPSPAFPATFGTEISSVKYIQLTRTGDLAEIALLSFPLYMVVIPAKESESHTSISPSLVATLTCSPELQRALILDLFVDVA